MIAAATTSLPEGGDGPGAWDYRYAWVRDLSVTARALFLAMCPTEPLHLLQWLTAARGTSTAGTLQIVYGVGGERDLTERVVDHLPGYAGGDVRVGNDAWRQRQLDVLGEVLDAAHLLLADEDADVDVALADLLVGLADRAAAAWQEPDAGMWEARETLRHYTSSKVMCWVALDRAVALGPRLGPRADVVRWSQARDAVSAVVLEQAWSERLGAYAGVLGSDEAGRVGVAAAARRVPARRRPADGGDDPAGGGASSARTVWSGGGTTTAPPSCSPPSGSSSVWRWPVSERARSLFDLAASKRTTSACWPRRQTPPPGRRAATSRRRSRTSA